MRIWYRNYSGILLAILAAASLGLGTAGVGWGTWRSSPGGASNVPSARVVPRSTTPAILLAGTVIGLEKTSVTVEVEQLQGSGGLNGGSPPPLTISWMIPDGTIVQKGELLARLDSAWIIEEARRQEIEVLRAESDKARADLSLRFALIDLKSYREGERVRLTQEKRVAVSLANTNQARARDHLDWTTRMLGLGYSSLSELKDEQTESIRSEVELDKARVALDVFSRYTLPRLLNHGESLIDQARAEAEFADAQLKLSRERLTKLRDQVEKCTILAPHPGRIIYADIHYREHYQLRPGAEVWQGQELFYLPDPKKMGVQVTIPEGFARRVRVGQEARVSIGAFPGETFAGKLKEISLLPVPDWFKWDDIPVFYGIVEVDGLGDQLLPDMSSQVDLLVGSPADRLVIPTTAITTAEGREFCYVLEAGHRTRREVRTSPSSPDWLEVLDGLAEGEVVELYPWLRPDPAPG